MLRLNNVIRLRYLAFILGWMGYASGLHAAALQLESTPLFLTFKVESNLVLPDKERQLRIAITE